MAKKKTTPTNKPAAAAEKTAGRSTRAAKAKKPAKPAPSPAAETIDPVPEEPGKPGRPSGSKNLDRVIVQRHPATCPQCGSTDRKVQRIAKEQDRGGIIQRGPNTGALYTHIVWRDTVCVCGQHLRELSHENRNGGDQV
ncbi:hypothetical protein C5Y96_05730 [Blastopirellula marina]|uniref:Uncharacterized protein n=1 Tax=Blastopirellula marina TaxID=124 RepID=A0A2S8G5C7_9BACT|nr:MULTISPECIES: hypothetical protein [Pirellulaceae]PQO39354.1 hypothetical protein C5Y96_05730 [Blastopirellula marina]RCS55662.1 hypothetical protein DTL36_05740 [Bremerella cremea]